MNRIKKGDFVRAHLDGSFCGHVVDVVSEKPLEYSAQGPMDFEMFCYVQLKDGRVIKKKSTDLYVEY